MEKTITRDQYMNDSENLHHKYHLQFMTDDIVESVKQLMPQVMTSKDEHLNDIPLHQWDSAAHYHASEMSKKCKELGTFYSQATGVCVLKAVARHLRKQANTNDARKDCDNCKRVSMALSTYKKRKGLCKVCTDNIN